MTRRAAPVRRIAFVSDAIYPYHKGGKEMRLYEISTRLARLGHDVHIYTMKWWDGPSTIREDGMTLHAISRLYPLYKAGRRSMIQAIAFGAATLRLLGAKFDVLDVDSMPFFPLFSARVVAWIKHRRLHATWHEVTDLAVWQAYAGRLAGLVGWGIERLAMLTPDVIISNSKHTTNRLQAKLANTPIITVPLGINVDNIYAVPPADMTSDLIFTGRLLPHKGVDLMLRALAILKKSGTTATAVIIGDGPERHNLEKLAKHLGISHQIRFVGFIADHVDVYALMKSSRVFVLPSQREGFGLVAIEAMAAGLPVVTLAHTDNAAKELVTEGLNGYLAEPTPKSVADAIQKALHPESGLNPTLNITDYDWSSVATQVEQAFTQDQPILPSVVTTSWDDGHLLDKKLATLLKRYHIKGTFYVAPEDHEFEPADRLKAADIKTIARDFEIGAHTITHPRLPQVALDTAKIEITGSKAQLEAIIGRPVTSFCYPGGEYRPEHVQMAAEAGYTYARTVSRFSLTAGPSPLTVPTTIHAYRHWSDLWPIAQAAGFNPVKFVRYLLNWDELAIALFNRSRRLGGVFHLWGHSWEIDRNRDWNRLERVLAYISKQPGVTYTTNGGQS